MPRRLGFIIVLHVEFAELDDDVEEAFCYYARLRICASKNPGSDDLVSPFHKGNIHAAWARTCSSHPLGNPSMVRGLALLSNMYHMPDRTAFMCIRCHVSRCSNLCDPTCREDVRNFTPCTCRSTYEDEYVATSRKQIRQRIVAKQHYAVTVHSDWTLRAPAKLMSRLKFSKKTVSMIVPTSPAVGRILSLGRRTRVSTQ